MAECRTQRYLKVPRCLNLRFALSPAVEETVENDHPPPYAFRSWTLEVGVGPPDGVAPPDVVWSGHLWSAASKRLSLLRRAAALPVSPDRTDHGAGPGAFLLDVAVVIAGGLNGKG